MTPPVHPHTPRVAVACRCTLGEEVVWDARDASLLWVDIEDPAIWRHWPATGETVRLPQGEKIGFAVPTTDPDRVVAGFQSGAALLRLSDGDRTPLIRPDGHTDRHRLNSGNTGPDGSLYFGSMDDAEDDEIGAFHRWDGTRLWSFGKRSAVTNGPVASPDGKRVYTVDTARGVVNVHDLGAEQIGEGRPLIRFEDGWGKPDGLTLDAEGHLWICHYGAGRITRFAPDGIVERILPMPTPLVTKCAFGGPELSTLYVTTCLRGRDPTIDPMAGHLYQVETDFRGIPASLWDLSRE